MRLSLTRSKRHWRPFVFDLATPVLLLLSRQTAPSDRGTSARTWFADLVCVVHDAGRWMRLRGDTFHDDAERIHVWLPSGCGTNQPSTKLFSGTAIFRTWALHTKSIESRSAPLHDSEHKISDCTINEHQQCVRPQPAVAPTCHWGHCIPRIVFETSTLPVAVEL